MFTNRRFLQYQSYPYLSPYPHQQVRPYRDTISSQAKLRAYREAVINAHAANGIGVGGGDGISFLGGSGASHEATSRDFTPQGYVTRPGSTPHSYSLWGSEGSTTTSDNSYKRRFNSSLKRVVFGCAVILVILAILGIVGIAVYLAIITNEEQNTEYNVKYSGKLKVLRGDTWIPELAFPNSPAFKAKALKYEKMLESVYDRSVLQKALHETKVVRFQEPTSRDTGFIFAFIVTLDRRKMPSHLANTEIAVRDVLLQELMSLEPVAFRSVDIDIDTLDLRRDRPHASPNSSGPEAIKQDGLMEIIKVDGGQNETIIIRAKIPGKKFKKITTEVPQSTVSNMRYHNGPWQPVPPDDVFRPSPPIRTFKQSQSHIIQPTYNPNRGPILISGPETRINVITTTTKRPRKTTTQSTTKLTTPSTTTKTTTKTTTTTKATTPSTTTHTTTVRPLREMTVEPYFYDRLGYVTNVENERFTTKRNPSKADIKSLLEDLLFFTTKRPSFSKPIIKITQPETTTFDSLYFSITPRPPFTRPSTYTKIHEQKVTPALVINPVTESKNEHLSFFNFHPTIKPSDKLFTFNDIESHYIPQTTQNQQIYQSTDSTSITAPETSTSTRKFSIKPRPRPIRLPLDRYRYNQLLKETNSHFPDSFPLPQTTREFSIWDFLTTKKPLILNTEVVTSTSLDMKFADFDLIGDGYVETEHSNGNNYVTVPIISGNDVRYLTINRTRSNYPNVVIVNLPKNTDEEVSQTTPMTPMSHGTGKRFNTKYLDDVFKFIANIKNHQLSEHLSRNPEQLRLNNAFSNRQGKPINLNVDIDSTPLRHPEGNKSLSIWSLLNGLSALYLSDPAIIHQLKDFDSASSGDKQYSPPTDHLPIENKFLDYLIKNPIHESISDQSIPNSNVYFNNDPLPSQTPYLGYGLTGPESILASYLSSHSPSTNHPMTTLFMSGIEGKSATRQVVSITSRSPVISSQSQMANSPIHTFVLKDGQSLEGLLQEIFEKLIDDEEQNEIIIPTTRPDIIDTTTHSPSHGNNDAEMIDDISQMIADHINSMAEISDRLNYTETTYNSHHGPQNALSQAQYFADTSKRPPSHQTKDRFRYELFPVMTRPLNRVTTPVPINTNYETATTIVPVKIVTSFDVSYSVHTGNYSVDLQYPPDSFSNENCTIPSKFQCTSGQCVSNFQRCNMIKDCLDGTDEESCTCADILKSKFLTRKLCDGIIDCWDRSDETKCDWCLPGQFICPGSRKCVAQTMVCDGVNDCPAGEDENTCVTIAPNTNAANSLNYYDKGYLMVRKKGSWGKLCIDNFERSVATADSPWTVLDLGQAVCKTLTFKSFERVERMTDLSPPLFRAIQPKYYEMDISDSSLPPSRARETPSPTLDFRETNCPKRDVVKVTCKDLNCGMRPKVIKHRARYVREPKSREPRIVGGNNSAPGSWPWHAALYKEGDYQCGATLISEFWLISAGHCFYGATDAYWIARLGALRRGTNFPSPYEQLKVISHIFMHPEYVDTGFVNDISLLKMTAPVHFTDYVRPVCLPSPGTDITDGRIGTIVGWGQLFEVGKIFPDTLQEVEVPLISSHECRRRTIFIPLYRVNDNMFCAGFDRGGRDACSGDSGGPLVLQEPDGRWQLAGVTSNGYGCARPHRPGVYTKVVKYLPWMHQVMELTKNNKIRLVTSKCKGHRCPLGKCLPRSNVCNGYVDCSDGSDEKDCPP